MDYKDLKMEESVTYQAILAKGEQQGRLAVARKWLLLLGQQRLGSPSRRIKSIIGDVNEPEKLEGWMLRLDDASSWEDLLAAPSARPRRRKPTS